MAFQDQHMSFIYKDIEETKQLTRGFRTRRFKDALYVIETNEENRFSVGTKIVSIDNKLIHEIANEFNVFSEIVHERQDWQHILNTAFTINVENSKRKLQSLKLKDYESTNKILEPTMKEIDKGTILITLPSFFNVDRNLEFVQDYKNKFRSYTKLIIDVRENLGGNSASYSTLLPYIFSSNESPEIKSELKEFNYTKRNSDLFIKLCKDFSKNINDKNTLELFDEIIEKCNEHRGKGFVVEDFTEENIEKYKGFKGTKLPENVVVMIDAYCGSAAEYFVETCLESSKVRLIGRATIGVNDYSDLLIKEWDDTYSLYYPMSRRIHRTPYHPIHGKGIQPDY